MIAKQYSQERLMRVLVSPLISEKATYISDRYKQIAFKVATNATKPEIKAAVELMFNVQVTAVQVSCVKGKAKRVGRIMGRQNNWKKAYVSLVPGQIIDIASSEQG
jgi:large subunit ribosomal protein L23